MANSNPLIMRRRSLMIDDALWEQMVDLAWRNRRSVSEEIRAACDNALKAEAKKQARTAR